MVIRSPSAHSEDRGLRRAGSTPTSARPTTALTVVSRQAADHTAPTDPPSRGGATMSDRHAYFFKDAGYVRYNIDTDLVDVGPVAIGEFWTHLPAEFHAISTRW
jgi:hypothetical protein